MEQPSPHTESFLGRELLLSVSQRQSLGPIPPWAPAPTVTMCLHIYTTGLPNGPSSSFSACSPSSSSSGTRSSSLAGLISSNLGEPLGTPGQSPTGKTLGWATRSQRGSEQRGRGLGSCLQSLTIINGSFFCSQKSLGLDDKTSESSCIKSFVFEIRQNWVSWAALSLTNCATPILSFIHSCKHALSQHFLRAYYVLSIMLDAGDTDKNK